MVSVAELRQKRIYLDSNIFIYALESLPPWSGSAQALLAGLDTGSWASATSELTLAECLIRPLERNQPENVELVERAIASRPHLDVVPVSRSILREAAKVRATSNLKLPDAIHVATAHHSRCELLATNDLSIVQRVSGLKCLLLSEVPC